MTIRAITLPFILLLTAAAPAQDTTTQPSSDVERMVADGMTEALTARLGDGRTADEKHLLARAFVSRARRARQPEERESAFAEADAKYQAWFEALEQEPGPHGAVHSVRLAAARVEYAGAVPSGQIAGETAFKAAAPATLPAPVYTVVFRKLLRVAFFSSIQLSAVILREAWVSSVLR